MNYVDLRGHIPATCGEKGGSFCPLQRRGPVRPENVLEKKQNGVRAWAAGALRALRNCIWGRWGHVGTPALRAVCLYPQSAERPGGIPPPWPFPPPKKIKKITVVRRTMPERGRHGGFCLSTPLDAPRSPSRSPAPVLSPGPRRAAVWSGRGATARPREARWSSGTAAVLGVCYNRHILKDPFGHHH